MGGSRLGRSALVAGLALFLAACGPVATSHPGSSPSPDASRPGTSPSPSAAASLSRSPSVAASPSPARLPTPLPSTTTLPSSGAIAYTVGQLGGEQVIELTRPDRSAFPDGQMLVDLTTGRDPSWSSDGRTLVYACPAPGNVGGFPAVCSVAMADPELTRTVVLREGDRPRLSPDGSRIVVHRGMIDVGETWIAAADGSGARLLTDGALLDWSPDGAWLLGQPESATAQVAVVRPDGTGYRVLASGRDATWAPDSTRIGFVAVADGGSSLQVIDAASGSTEVLFRPDAGMTIASPEWLEDGRIVFAMDGDLWRLDPGAGAPVRLTARLEIAGALSASPDGAWIAFATDRLDGATTPSTLAIASIEGGWVTLQGPVLSTPPEWQPVAVP